MLTHQQSRLLEYLKSYAGRDNISPSFQEMSEAIGLRSKAGVHRLISGLEERGFIRRLHGRARAIEVIDQARETETPKFCPHCGKSLPENRGLAA